MPLTRKIQIKQTLMVEQIVQMNVLRDVNNSNVRIMVAVELKMVDKMPNVLLDNQDKTTQQV